MPRVEMHLTSTSPPGRIRDALTDFSPDRPKIWPGISPSLYEVYQVEGTWAEIKEGTKIPGSAVWAREHYDWSDPDIVRWTVSESNFCAPGSFVEAAIRSDGKGGSTIDLIWNRTPTTLSARVTMALIVATRGLPIARSMRAGLAKLETE
ncbi:MAG: hypothetical protein QOF35_1839 [Actinomycetota bacterium]|jgi:hypothetical protein|nr:hypothetical protein [Actinomycetota bacterium]